jgi:hypothetical protein
VTTTPTTPTPSATRPPTQTHDEHTERAIRQLAGYTIQATAAVEQLETTLRAELKRTRNAVGWQVLIALIIFAIILGAVAIIVLRSFA